MRRTAVLDLDMYGKKTYNVLQSAIATNAIDSERTDKVIFLILSSYQCTSAYQLLQDYFFHPSVRIDALYLLIHRLTMHQNVPALVRVMEALSQ